MILQAVFAEEIEARGGVGIVLMFGWLLRLGFDVELALKADLLLVLDGHVEETAEVIEFAFDVGVPKRGIAFAATPKDIACAAEFVGNLDGFFDLRGGVSEDVGIASGGCAMHITRMGKEASGAPEKLYAGAFLFLFEDRSDRIEILVGGREVFAFGGNVAVVKGVERRAEFLDELEGNAGAFLGVLH